MSEVYLQSHLRGKKHQAAVVAHLPGDSTPAAEDSVIVDAAEEHQGPSGGQPEIQQRMQAGKKKARKLRQRMSNRYELCKKMSPIFLALVLDQQKNLKPQHAYFPSTFISPLAQVL